jgi:aquaporin Z
MTMRYHTPEKDPAAPGERTPAEPTPRRVSPGRQRPPQSQRQRERRQGHLGHERGTNFHSDPEDSRAEWRRLLAELLGTFLLTLVAAGAAVIGTASGHPLSLPVKVVAPALIVLALIYTLGDVSGAHLNPAVTLAFTLRRDFPVRRVPGYWLAQLVGASLAALFLRMTFGNVAHLGATLPDHRFGAVPAVIMEFVLTAILVVVILSTAHHHRIVGHNAAFAVAATIACTGLFAGPISGASMNPARSFGPDLIGGNMATFWVYLVGPLAGALLASGIAWVLEGATNRYAVLAATGD